MIKKSKRKYHKNVLTLEVHKGMASKRYWANRLIVCSLGALLASVLGWIFSLELPLHWLILGLGFLAGFAFPLQSTQAWALAWIRDQVGLSYEAALESQPDNYGFYEQLQARAKQQLRQLERPKSQPWWLPIMIVAASITLLPLIPKAFSSFTPPSSNPSSSIPPIEKQPPNATPQDTPSASQASSPPTPNEEASSPQNTNDTQELNGELAQGSDKANRDNQVADEEALSRFLDELQEQKERGEVDTNNVSPELQPGQSSNGEDEASHPREQQSNPFEKITDPKQSNSESEVGQTQSENQQNQPGQEENESTQLTESQSPNQETSEPQAQENNTGGSSTQGQEGQEALRDEGEGEGAGVLGSEGSEGQTQGLEGESQQTPELLAGQITQGPQNVAGTVRLPNTQDDVAPISNTISPSFRPSDEEALTEGKIPLEYQNIIRNYFRY